MEGSLQFESKRLSSCTRHKSSVTGFLKPRRLPTNSKGAQRPNQRTRANIVVNGTTPEDLCHQTRIFKKKMANTLPGKVNDILKAMFFEQLVET
jgi:hypothetical protein